MYLEVGAEGVHRLHTHTVQTHALLESLGVVLAAGVQHGHGFYEFAQGDAASVVTDAAAQLVGDAYFDAFSGAHLELVDTVVDDFLEEHVDAVLGMGTVTQSAYVHAGAGTHVLHVGEVAYVLVGVIDGLGYGC